MKYYYDDPLVAAWMAENFKIRFLYKTGKIINRGWGRDKIQSDEQFVEPYSGSWHWPDWISRHYGGFKTKYYIHPDSLNLLESRVGDLIEWSPETGLIEYEVLDSVHDYDKGLKIIQRNNTPFHWPKQEP